MIETTSYAGVRTIRLTHGKANAMDVELLEALREALCDAQSCRALILTGSGNIFCAGVDLVRMTNGGESYARQFFPVLNAFMRELFEFPLPVVVACNGHAIAGGGLMVMAGDYRIMADGKGRVGIPELLVGVRFPAVPLEIVRWAVPADRVQSLVYRGTTYLPQDALKERLVDEVVEADRLIPRAEEVTRDLMRIPPENFRAAKLALRAPALERMDRAGQDLDTADSWAAPVTQDRIKTYLAALDRGRTKEQSTT